MNAMICKVWKLDEMEESVDWKSAQQPQREATGLDGK